MRLPAWQASELIRVTCPAQATPELVARALQTHSMLAIRTGVVLLGPAACGKSSIVRTLQVGGWWAGAGSG